LNESPFVLNGWLKHVLDVRLIGEDVFAKSTRAVAPAVLSVLAKEGVKTVTTLLSEHELLEVLTGTPWGP
jgi:hypothetical protein